MSHALPAGGRGYGTLLRQGTLAQAAALLAGLVFLVIGILGFIPGITTHVDDMQFAGHDSPSELFGIFQVSVLHNLVHLALGVVGVVLSRTHALARSYLIGGGIVYLAIWLFGIATDNHDDINFIPVNDADDWLHLGLGVGMILLGVLLWSGERQVRSPAQAR
jgi:hypothetical protein